MLKKKKNSKIFLNLYILEYSNLRDYSWLKEINDDLFMILLNARIFMQELNNMEAQSTGEHSLSVERWGGESKYPEKCRLRYCLIRNLI